MPESYKVVLARFLLMGVTFDHVGADVVLDPAWRGLRQGYPLIHFDGPPHSLPNSYVHFFFLPCFHPPGTPCEFLLPETVMRGVVDFVMVME